MDDKPEMPHKDPKRLQDIAVGIGVVLVIVLFVTTQCGCLAVPRELEDSVHSAFKGNVVICGEYADLVIAHYPEGKEREDRLVLVEKHLEHMKELDDYVKNKGGRILWPWQSWKPFKGGDE